MYKGIEADIYSTSDGHIIFSAFTKRSRNVALASRDETRLQEENTRWQYGRVSAWMAMPPKMNEVGSYSKYNF